MYKSVIGFTRGCEVEIKLLSDATLLQSTVYNINLSELISRVARFCKIVASEPLDEEEIRARRSSSVNGSEATICYSTAFNWL